MREFSCVIYKMTINTQEARWRSQLFQSLLVCDQMREGILSGSADLSVMPKIYGLRVTLDSDNALTVETLPNR